MGLIYASDESTAFIEALHSNLTSGKEAIQQLKAGSQQVVAAVDGQTLAGAAYTAGKGLFSELIIPTIQRVLTVCDVVTTELQTYQAADQNLAGESYLDEDNLHQQIAIKKEMQSALDTASQRVEMLVRSQPIVAIVDSLVDFQRQLHQMANELQNDIDQCNQKLDKLYEFAYRTDGLFANSLAELNLAMQSVGVLKDLTVNEDGTYTFPPGVDQSWFTQLKTDAQITRNAYDRALEELLTYDSNGTIADVNEGTLKEWLILFAQGKLTPMQVEALKTTLLAFPGYVGKKEKMEDVTDEMLQKLARLQDTIGHGWSIFGFGYNQEGKHFYTKQDSMQSWFGFGDIYDEVGPLLGMDLDTEMVQFYHEGKEYRFQVWKGTYGGGTLVGGEQGWYVHDPRDIVQSVQNGLANRLGQKDWVPVASPEDRIRMVNILYNETTGLRITEASDTNQYAPEGAYWNLDTTAKHPGYTKSNIYTEGELYIDDIVLRRKVYQELKANHAFSNVQIIENRVIYTWKD